MEFCSAVQNEIMIFEEKQMEPESIILGEIS